MSRRVDGFTRLPGGTLRYNQCGQVVQPGGLGVGSHRRKHARQAPMAATKDHTSRIRCTASSEQRTFVSGWSDEIVRCPDCGGEAKPWVRATDLFPHAKIRSHLAPQGVEPRPYGILPRGVEAVSA